MGIPKINKKGHAWRGAGNKANTHQAMDMGEQQQDRPELKKGSKPGSGTPAGKATPKPSGSGLSK
tara:strand:- start:36 stop:230 length:195 start_codon:yes stop_codon:yes gene_type:complete